MQYRIIRISILLLFGVIISPVEAQNSATEKFYQGGYQSVIAETSKAISSGDTSYNNFYLQALSQIQLGQTENAITTLSNALSHYPDDSKLSRILAGQYFAAGTYPESERIYTNLVQTDSKDIAAWIKLAEIASFRQHYTDAIQFHLHILLLDSTNMNTLIQLGEILERENHGDAEKYYRKAYELYPDNQQVAYSLSNWYVRKNKPELVIPICEGILESDSTNIRFQKLIGYAYHKMDRANPSIQHFEKAVELGDSTAFSFKFLGIGYHSVYSTEKAIKALGYAVKKDSLDAELHFFMGASLAYTVDKSKAIAHLDTALKIISPEPFTVSRILSEQGNIKRLETKYEEAYELYDRAWRADTTNLMAIYYKASILDNSLHRLKEALVEYEFLIQQLDIRAETAVETKFENTGNQGPSIRGIVEDRIITIKEELFFLDE